jgi:hypothetical protein
MITDRTNIDPLISGPGYVSPKRGPSKLSQEELEAVRDAIMQHNGNIIEPRLKHILGNFDAAGMFYRAEELSLTTTIDNLHDKKPKDTATITIYSGKQSIELMLSDIENPKSVQVIDGSLQPRDENLKSFDGHYLSLPFSLDEHEQTQLKAAMELANQTNSETVKTGTRSWLQFWK